MIICDITHQTEIAGSAIIELRRDGQEPITVRLDLSPEALSALEAGDWVVLGKLAAEAAPLNRAKRPRTVQDGSKPKQKTNTDGPAALAAKTSSPATRSNGKTGAKAVEAPAQLQVATQEDPKVAVAGPETQSAVTEREPKQLAKEAPLAGRNGHTVDLSVVAPGAQPGDPVGLDDNASPTGYLSPNAEMLPDEDDFDENIF